MQYPIIAPHANPAFAFIQPRFLAAVAGLPPAQASAGEHLFQRISTVNWLLEWSLPGWLGEAFQLPQGSTRQLTLGNVFGLAFIRLQDDLFDGESTPAWQDSAALAKALHALWLAQYRPLFPRHSPFWNHLDTFSGQWLRASLENTGPAGDDLRAGNEDAMRWLAARGAPLKVCCAAACLLAERQDALDPLLAGVDQLLSGAVLVDHATDWQADLDSGRYNALASFYAAGSTAADPSQAVLEGLYLGSGASGYFDLALRQYRTARSTLRGMPIPHMDEYLDWVEEKIVSFHAQLIQEYSHRLQMAVRDLLPPAERNDLPLLSQKRM